MSYQEVKNFMEELADINSDKFLFILEHPEWECWFIGRAVRLLGQDTNIDMVKAAILELTKGN